MLLDRRNTKSHNPWIVFVVLVTVASIIWYVAASQAAGKWLGGGSLPGFTFGVVGGLLILFEFALWGKKKCRTWRIGRARTWMQAHIWLGLLTVPMILLHSGGRLGGPFGGGGWLTGAMMILFALIIASGIYGLILQQWIPRKMFDEIPAETIYSQIDVVMSQFCRDGETLVQATCGSSADDPTAALGDQHRYHEGTYVTVGAIRSAGKVQGKVLQTKVPAHPVPNSEPLRAYWRQAIEPYLMQGAKSHSPLQLPNRSEVIFADLRTKLAPEAHDTVMVLEQFCEQRRQLDNQARLHFWMHNWLIVHTPLSLALVILMIAHVVAALKYM